MAGNSQRKGAIKKTGKGNPTAGSGGRVRRGLEGKGPTPKAKDRPYHKQHKIKAKAEKVASSRLRRAPGKGGDSEWIAGRNSVDADTAAFDRLLEAMRMPPVKSGDTMASAPTSKRAAYSPAGTGTLPAGIIQTNLSLTTDESATCRYATTAGVAYASMPNSFTTTGATSHSTTATR